MRPKNLIFIGFILFLTIVFIADNVPGVNAAPLSHEKRDNATTAVNDADISDFKLWSKFASAVYCNVSDWNCGAACKGETDGTKVVKFIASTPKRDNSAFVAINDKLKAIIVAFRGTSDPKSLVQDLQFNLVPYFEDPKAKVHSGFLATYNDTRDTLNSVIKETVANNPEYKVVVTGHSLGGALAAFQTLDLKGILGLDPSKVFTYTYGAPRPGNKEFAELVEKSGFKFFRVVNKSDIVPSIPPPSFNYQHYGPEFWIEPDNKVVECQQAETKNCALSQTLFKLNFIDHAHYFDTLFLLTCLKK